MLNEKQWIYNEISDEYAERIAREAGISELMARVLINRGLDDTERISKFLNPAMSDIHDPFLMRDMDRAVERIAEAAGRKEKIVIYGDYDVDGITSTSILYDFLSGQGANVSYYIPDRIDEGYGLSTGAIDRILQEGLSLLITVDCGITSIDEVKYLRDSGIDVIITDHHRCISELPEALAVINPCRPDCRYPFKSLAGVGVVYKLINALCRKMNLGELYLEYLDLVALGTIADVVPLVDENRIIVKQGTRRIENTANIGLRAIIDNSGLKGKAINTYSISFTIAPRVNVAGRIGDAERAVRLFTEANEEEALEIVEKLNEENRYRQDTENQIFQQAVELIEADGGIRDNKVLVVSGDCWHHGIIGIVASKITERYYKPCILISTDNGTGKGSGRSIEGLNLFEALNSCSDLLERYGGHELAAGLTIKAENIGAFSERINLYADGCISKEDMLPKIRIDARICRKDISIDSVRELEKLAPYGAGNPGPVFSYQDFKVSDIRTVGESKHLKLKLDDNGFGVDAIGFNMGRLMGAFENVESLDVACLLELNSWNSTEKVQLNLKDIRPGKGVLMENNYYRSLDGCLDFQSVDGTIESGGFPYARILLNSDEDILEALGGKPGGRRKTAVLVNSLESARNIEKILKKYSPGIKKGYKICYTCCNDEDFDKIHVIVNPIPSGIKCGEYDCIIFYGDFVCRSYLRKLAESVDIDKAFFYLDKREAGLDIGDFVPERRDLVAVYQYLKAHFDRGMPVEDLFAVAKRISNSYKLPLNYFKVNKCVEILEELGLLERQQYGECGFIVTAVPRNGEKTNIENSILYRKLQVLKKGG